MPGAAPSLRGAACGLALYADCELPPLAAPKAPVEGSLELRCEIAGRSRDPSLPGARTICREAGAAGVAFAIEHESSPACRYLIHGPRYGAFLLDGDGRRCQIWPRGADAAAWQRLLLAQVVPFAAVLQGFEVLHASAVAAGGSAWALVGRSGAGKTTTALALRRRGARFLADDVVALRPAAGGLTAYPGAAIAFDERERRLELGEVAGPTPLSAAFFLDRRQGGPAVPRFEPAADPRLLLSATFNTALRDPRRLRNLLEVSAELGRRRVERVIAGPRVSPERLAAAIAARAGEAG